MGLAGFSGSGNDARIWRIGGTADTQSNALRLASDPPPQSANEYNNDCDNDASKRLPASPYLLPRGVVVDAGGQVGTVVPLLGGGSLAHRVATTGPLTASECIIVLKAMSEALRALHAAGLVHLDISPANIVLTAEGNPVLVDTADVQPATGQSCRRGTPPYTVPGADASPATDWIALGRVVTELASGSTLTAATRLPDPLRTLVAELLAGREPAASHPQHSPGDLVLEVYPRDYSVASDQRATIDFADGSAHHEEASAPPLRSRRARAGCIGVLVATVALVSASVALSDEAVSCPQSASGSDTLHQEYPGATIVHADSGSECPVPVVWLPNSGELVVTTSAGLQTFSLGQLGDELSFGDWNCDGVITPALTRGNRFYMFDGWPQQAPIAAIEIGEAPAACTDTATRRGG